MKEKTNYGSRIFKIAFPIMLSNLVIQLQMMIDKIFLGRLDISNMSAVGNATSPMWTTMNIIYALTIGATVLVSQAIGRDDKEEAYIYNCSMFKYNNYLAGILFLFWLICPGVAFKLMDVPESIMDMSISYARIYSPVFLIAGLGASFTSLLQNAERTKALIVSGIVRSGLNILLDWVLIFGNLGLPRMEIAGASLATTIAEYVGGIALLVIVVKDKKLEMKPKIKDIFRAKIGPYIRSARMGLPTALEELAWNIGNLSLIVVLNHVSDAAAGVYTIVFGIECLPVVVFGALGNAALTLSGQETGRGDDEKIKKIVNIALFWSFCLSVLIMVFFVVIPEPIMGCFTKDQDIIMSSGLYLMIVGINLFPKSANMIAGSGIKGHGDTKWMLYTQIFGTIFVVGMAVLLVFVFDCGIAELFWLVVADETIRCLLNYAKLLRISRSKTETANSAA